MVATAAAFAIAQLYAGTRVGRGKAVFIDGEKDYYGRCAFAHTGNVGLERTFFSFPLGCPFTECDPEERRHQNPVPADEGRRGNAL